MNIRIQYLFLILIIAVMGCATSKHESINNRTKLIVINDVLIKEGYRSIPIIKYKSGHLRINAKLNGIHTRLLLDSGADKTFIEASKNSKLGLESRGTDKSASGAGASHLQMTLATVESFEIEDFIIYNLEVGLMNLNHINISLINARMEPVDGILGADILFEYDAVIDYRGLILYLKPKN